MDDDPFVEDQGDEYHSLLAQAKSYLPFLKEVIEGTNLGIQQEHLGKLRSLYEMVDAKRLFDMDLPSDLWLTLDKLRNCQNVLDSLHAKYHKGLTKEQLKNIDDSKKRIQLNEEKTITKSSDMASTSNDIDQTLYSKSGNSRKIPELRDMKDDITNKQLDSQEQHNEPLENFLDSMKNRKFSCSNSSKNDDPTLLKDDLPQFSDSRLRLNKVIGFATNASIEKLNASNKNVSEIAKEIFEEITRQNTNQAICQNMLKGINMDDIDVNHVKKVIESIHGTKNIEPIQHPPLPPTNLLDLGLTRVLISPVEVNAENDLSKIPEQQHYSTLVSSKLPSIREKLNSDINVLHKIGASSKIESKPKQTFISALKPGTLIDLENSKVTRTSLHIESLRPSANSNEKNIDIKSPGVKSGIKLIEKITDGKFVPDVAVRDPRIRNKYSKNPENVNLIPLPIQANAQKLTCAPLIPSVQSSHPNNSSLFSPNTSFSKSTLLFESNAPEITPPLASMNNYFDNTSQKEISVYNEPLNVLSPHVNMQPFQKQFPTEHNGNSNSLQFNSCSSLTQSQNKHRNDFIVDKRTNDFRHHASHSNQMHVNPISQNEIIRHREPVLFKSHSVARRDPRSMNCEKKMYEPRSYKEYREAKYGRDKNSYRGFSHNSKMNQNHERDRHRTVTRDEEKWRNVPKSDSKNSNPYRNLGVINDSAFNKSFKIPKIKRDDEIIDKNVTSKELKTKKDTITETIEDNNAKNDLIIVANIDNNADKDLKSEIVKNNIKLCSSKIEEDSKIENHIAKDSTNSINEVGKSIENHISNELKKNTSKPKKPKKYSKEKEFEKIVKEAVESLNDDVSGPRTRTRSSLKKKEKETLKELNLDDSDKIDIEKKVAYGECCKNINPTLHQNIKDLDRSIETGHNVISSTSKDISEVDCSTETIIDSQQENIVSSNEINSTADTPSNSNINVEALNRALANPKLLSLFQDNEKVEKLYKLLENDLDIENINENKSKNQNISNENIDIHNEQNASKQNKKMKKKEKKKRKKELKLKIDNKESSLVASKNTADVNAISNDDILDKEEITETIKDDTNRLDSLKNIENPSSGSNFGHLSTNQVKSKSNKRTKYRPQYEIRKDEDFKIVISKYNKNCKTIENAGLNNYVQATNKRKMKAKDEVLHIVKPKKPFLGPLSVKLAKLKMANEQDNSQKLDEKSQLEEVNSENNEKHHSYLNQINENSNSNETNSLSHEPPFVLLKSIEDNSSTNVTSSTIATGATHFQDKSTISEQNSNKITLNNRNIIDNKLEVKKHRPKMTELDKLHADINENCAAVLSVPCVRQCRTNKQVNYVNSSNVISSKKNKNSNVEQLNLCDELTSGVENSKATKKLSNKLTLKLKKNKQNVKKSGTKKMCHPKITKNVLIDKKLKASQPCKLKKLKSSKKKNKPSLNLTSMESHEELNLSNELNHEMTSVVTPKVLTKNEFKDKLYFQSTVDSMECKFCNFYDKGFNIIRHYVEQHRNEEVLPSRLSKDCAEILINESNLENYAFINVDQFEDSKSSHVPVTVQFTCVFCKMLFFNIIEFLDHVTCHTGEYRYKCKICEQIYPHENELKKHISEHSSYDKTDGIPFLLFPNPIQSHKLFGYLCPFCYYIQLDYTNMVKHMTLRHFDEDKKCNGHWTIIRVNMSIEDNSYINSVIDYNNLAGCLPPVQFDGSTHQTISKDENPDNQMQSITISEPIIHSKNNLKVASVFIKKESCEQEMLEDLLVPNKSQPSSKHSNFLCTSESITVQLLPKQSNPPCKSESIPHKLSPKHMNPSCMMESDLLLLPLKQTDPPCKSEAIIHTVSPKHSNFPCTLESNFLQFLPKQTDPPCKLESNMHKLSPKHVNSPCMPESSLLQLSPNQTTSPCMPGSKLLQLSPNQITFPCKSESIMHQLSPKHINHPSMLESNLLQPSPIKTNPSYVSESNMLQLLPNQENPCIVESEMLKLSSKQESLLSNVLDLKSSSIPTMCQETIEKSISKPLLSLRVRNLPGDKLSIPKSPTSITTNSSASKSSIDTHSNGKKDLNVVEEFNEYNTVESSKQSKYNVTLNTPNESSDLNAIEEFNENGMVESTEKSNHNVVQNTPNESSDDQTNINQVSINGGLSKIVKVVSLKKSNLELNSSKTVNDGLSLWKKVTTLNETVFPEPIINRKLGLQAVNNGELRKDGGYTLIDTNFIKDSLKKARDFPMSVIKSRHALKEMTSVPKLLGLYKCFERSCTQIFNSKDLFILHMKLHFSNTEKKKKNQIYCVEQFKKCAYCFKSFDDEVSLANHIEDNYTFCKYCCPYCFYRAYAPSHVLVHQSLIHTKSKLFVLKLGFAKEDCKTQNEILKVVNFKNYVPTYSCNIGECEFKCYLESDFISHLNQVHQQCDKYYCYICSEDKGENFTLQPKVLINHFKLHNINLYQCIFCLFGTDIVNSMMNHLAMEHFEYEPLCLERSHMFPSDKYNGEEISNLKIIRLQKVVDDNLIETVDLPSETSSFGTILPQKTKKRRSGCSDVLSAAVKSARIDESSQSSDTIVITVPDKAQMKNSTSLTSSSDMDSEFIFLDDDINQKHEKTLKIDNIWSMAGSDQNDQSDVIVIDDDDDDDDVDNTMLENDESNKVENVPTKRKHSIEEPSGGSIKPKRLALPMVALDKLFTCKKCDKVYSNGNDYHMHLNHCRFWNSEGQKCVFCSKIFKTTSNMTEHIRLHGPDRFKCSLCDVNLPSSRAITHHMKINHSITNLNIVPVNPGLDNLEKDEFIVYEKKTLDPKINTMETCVKKKRSNNFGKKKESSKTKDNKTKSLVFSPDTIGDIPKMHIFSETIGCSLCSYQTKVRSNLVRHIEGHEKGQDNTTKEIVNPVPSMGKTELMFDKMINLSASSFEAMNTEKAKIDELNKKIVEVAPQDININLFPKLIHKNTRYKCTVASCSYIGMTTDMLKKHISILHPEYKYYICPHCTPECVLPKTIDFNEIDYHLMHHKENLYSCQYCNYIDFNRIEMKTHMRNNHLSELTTAVQSNIIVIRKLTLEDDSVDRTIYARATMAQWVCNICSSGIKYTENEIISHIFVAHKVTKKFKCPMCPFEHIKDDSKIFEEHYKLTHPSVAVKCLKVYDKIDNVYEQQKQSKPLPGAAYILEQQALESIEPTIVPPTCRGIPIDSIPIVKASTKSRGVSKSPKAKATAKNSPNQARKQLISTDIFSKSDSLGSISCDGLFTCPRCDVFKTMNVDHFREHLYKDVNYKTWKCLKCHEISDSPKKMAWHVKKHGSGSKYEKIEDVEKLEWVERVLAHQNSLLNEFQKQNKEKCERDGVEQKTDNSDEKTVDSSFKKNKNIGSDKKIRDSNTIVIRLDHDVIDLLDDSDDE